MCRPRNMCLLGERQQAGLRQVSEQSCPPFADFPAPHSCKLGTPLQHLQANESTGRNAEGSWLLSEFDENRLRLILLLLASQGWFGDTS